MKQFLAVLAILAILAGYAIAQNEEIWTKKDDNTLTVAVPMDYTYEYMQAQIVKYTNEKNAALGLKVLANTQWDNTIAESQSNIDLWQARLNEAVKQGIKAKVAVIVEE